MDSVFNFLKDHGMEMMELLLAALGLFSVIAKMTPTKADDKVVNFFLSIIHKLGLTKK